MLKILDRYIIKKFLGTFLFTMAIFTMIAVVIDFSDKVEDFIEEQVPLSEMLFDYYLNFCLFMVGQLIPLYALISVIFFTSRMASNSETISILNAGVGFGRILRPYLISAGLIAGFHFIANHYLIPNGNKSRLDFEHTYIWKSNDKGKKSNVHFFIGPETTVYIKRYNKRNNTADDFRLEQIKDNKLIYTLKARKAVYVDTIQKWTLKDYEIHTFDGMKESLDIGLKKSMDTTLNLRPDDFIRFLNQKDMLITPELRHAILRDRERGVGNTKEYQVEVERRSSEPFSIIILTIIGVAIAGRKVRGGMGLHLLLGVICGAIYIFLIKFSITFANNDVISPMVGVWLPNFIFTIVAIYLVRNAQK